METIQLFYEKSKKKDNDSANKIREGILADILLEKVPAEYFVDSEYGAKWTDIQTKLKSCLEKHGLLLISAVEQKGGMSYNYDFQVVSGKTYKIEFKFNNTTVNKLAQVLELYDRDMVDKYGMVPVSYAEFYYTNYLDEYLKLGSFAVEKPPLEEYLRCVMDIKYKHPFIRQLYEAKDVNRKEKLALVSKSVKDYLTVYGPQFVFDGLEKKIRESQDDKTYLFWNGKDFVIQEVATADLKFGKVIATKNKNLVIQVDGFKYNISIRQNWGNNNGIANPRWKISYV
jgi:hypothetical protein